MHSTETATLQLTTDLLLAAGSWKTSIVVALDLTAAFDTISHSWLLFRLADFGICAILVEWNHILTGRTQYVNVEDSLSPITQYLSGVPQGSVPGRVISAYGIAHQQYADDTTLYTILDLTNREPLGNLNKYTEAVE